MLQLGGFFLAIYTWDIGVCIYGVDDEVIFILTYIIMDRMHSQN